jgi:predicted P-loop ATPase
MDIDALARDRDQLFAEAVLLCRDGARWWPDADFEREHVAPQQEARFEADAWESLVDDWLRRQVTRRVTLSEVATGAPGVKTDRIGTSEQRRIAAILERLDWRRAGRTKTRRWWEPG